jgi:2-methylcitrate dehydratase PrpD
MADETRGMTRALAGFIAGADAAGVPDEVMAHAKVAFMDWLAVAVAAKDEPLVDKLLRYAEAMGGDGQATVIGRGRRVSVEQAALINGAMSHALDFDDTIGSYIAHPSVALFPALLALSEHLGKSGKEFLTAYLVGFQVGATVGRSAGLEHYNAGWHSTSTIGAIASAAACAKLMGLDQELATHALGIGATQSSGLKIVFGTDCKPFHAGKASQSGLMAALLAKDGFTSAPDALEGPQGFFHAFKGAPDQEAIARLGKEWDVVHLAQKHHASCHATHSPIEAARAIIIDNKVDVNKVKSIGIRVSQLAMDIAGKKEPTTGLEAKFSITYCVANALLHDDTGMKAFSDKRANDFKVRDIMKRIEVSADLELQSMAAHVKIGTDDGKVFECSADVLNDIPCLHEKQMKIRAKFKSLVEPIRGEEATAALLEQINELERIENMKEFAGGLA